MSNLYLQLDLSKYAKFSPKKYDFNILYSNTAKSAEHRTIRDLTLFYNPKLTELALAPFGYSTESGGTTSIFSTCDYSFKAIIFDFLESIINQLLPTALWNMICDDLCDIENNNKRTSFAFLANCLKAITIDYPLSVIVFTARILTTILLSPVMIYAHHQSLQIIPEQHETIKPA